MLFYIKDSFDVFLTVSALSAYRGLESFVLFMIHSLKVKCSVCLFRSTDLNRSNIATPRHSF